MCVYIYIYIERERGTYIYIYNVCIYIYIYISCQELATGPHQELATAYTPNPPTNIVGFRGLDSSIILILRGGILTPIGNFPESLSQASNVSRDNVSREIGRTAKYTDSMVSQLQASGGIGTLQSRASGLQGTTQGIPSGPERLLRVKTRQTYYQDEATTC